MCATRYDRFITLGKAREIHRFSIEYQSPDIATQAAHKSDSRNAKTARSSSSGFLLQTTRGELGRQGGVGGLDR